MFLWKTYPYERIRMLKARCYDEPFLDQAILFEAKVSLDLMKLCILILPSVAVLQCIVIDKDYNLAMDDELLTSSTTQSSSSSSYGSLNRRKGRRNCTRDTAIIDKLLNGTGYNKFRIPNDDGVKVSVQFWINTITSINEITNDFEMDIYINEMWLDPALNFENLSPCKHNLSLSHQVGAFVLRVFPPFVFHGGISL
ncbi:hypothetical protein COOONC_10875 [Cooperia oncophora]